MKQGGPSTKPCCQGPRARKSQPNFSLFIATRAVAANASGWEPRHTRGGDRSLVPLTSARYSLGANCPQGCASTTEGFRFFKFLGFEKDTSRSVVIGPALDRGFLGILI